MPAARYYRSRRYSLLPEGNGTPEPATYHFGAAHGARGFLVDGQVYLPQPRTVAIRTGSQQRPARRTGYHVESDGCTPAEALAGISIERCDPHQRTARCGGATHPAY